MRALRFTCVLILLGSAAAFAALHFPALSGRVVDEAHILSPGTVQSLDQMMADYERGTTNQVVVVTLASLQGTSIEDYGYKLGRYWEIGQKGKDNGALLIVAPQERKVRIEVGYGLEPLLTDANSSFIINSVILPDFRSGNMEKGIVEGTRAMLTVLGGKSIHADTVQEGQPTPAEAIFWILFLLWLFWFSYHHPWLAAYMMSTSRFGSSRLGGSGWGGGFSGGGGSFGGGGASGGW
jgi:uncharacterized protein